MEVLNCTYCKEVKPLSEFNKSPKEKRGYRYNCKPCSKSKYKTYLSTVDGALDKRRSRDKKAKQVQRDRIKLVPPTDKKCYCCGEIKEIKEFGVDRMTVNGSATICKPCKRKKIKFYFNSFSDERKEDRRLKNLRYNLKYNFNLSLEDYETMVEQQNGVCAICSQPPIKGNGNRLHIDHNHSTGKIRGLLCSTCNQGLGFFQDSFETLLSASHYLKERG